MSIARKTAIAGVGATPYYRRGQSVPQTLNELVGKSIIAAVADAGLKISDVDGFAYYSEGFDTPYLMETLGIPEGNVTVNVTLLGGGFGRKSKCDFAIEAALLSKELGAPVKVQWTREDDVRNGFLHTVSVERIEAGLDKSGKVTAWRHRSVAPTIASTFAAGVATGHS